MTSRSAGALFFLYPVWVHLAISLGWTAYALSGLLVIAFAVESLRGGGRPRGVVVWITLGAIAALAAADVELSAPIGLYLPPVMIPLGLALIFARSLRPGYTPIVVLFARRVAERRSVERECYATRVTWFWAIALALLSAEAILLALFASPRWWSLMTNFGNYLLLLVFFMGEFAVRCWRFGWPERPAAMLERMLTADWRQMSTNANGNES